MTTVHIFIVFDKLFSPGSALEQVQSYFVGSGPQLINDDVIASGSDRYRLQTIASGTVYLSLYIVTRNFHKFGIETWGHVTQNLTGWITLVGFIMENFIAYLGKTWSWLFKIWVKFLSITTYEVRVKMLYCICCGKLFWQKFCRSTIFTWGQGILQMEIYEQFKSFLCKHVNVCQCVG